MTVARTALAVAVGLVLAGCAPKVFVHPNPGAVNQMADASQCDYEILMAQRGVRVPYWYNNNQAAGYLIGAVIGQAIRNDQLRTLCMQAKGYLPVPVAYGAPVPIGEAQPYLPGIAPPVAYAPYNPAALPPQQPSIAGRGDIGPAGAPPTAAAPTVATSIKGESKYLFTAEGIAKGTGCNPPSIAMTAKGAGSESFMVGCPNGTTLAMRCEIDGCRILQ